MMLSKIFSFFKKSAKKLPRGHVYIKSDHHSWGNSINLSDSPKTMIEVKRIDGHLSRIPEVGDILQIAGEDSLFTFEYQFTEVRPCGNPSDMFFADVELIGSFDKSSSHTYIEATG